MRIGNIFKDKITSNLGVLILTCTLVGCDQSRSESLSFVYVDINKAINDSDLINQESKRNKDVKDVLLKAQKKAMEKYKNMNEEQVKKSTVADEFILNQIWNAELQHSRKLTLDAVSEAVDAYRESNKVIFVFNSSAIISGAKDKDVTIEIIKLLENKKIQYGDLPKLEVSEGQNK